MSGEITLVQLQKDSYRIAKEHGFWQTYDNIANVQQSAAEDGTLGEVDTTLPDVIIDSKLMLIVGEVAEAEDALRHNKGMSAVGEELADIMIRTADLAEALGISLDDAVYAKQKFNETRPYKHGKRF